MTSAKDDSKATSETKAKKKTARKTTDQAQTTAAKKATARKQPTSRARTTKATSQSSVRPAAKTAVSNRKAPTKVAATATQQRRSRLILGIAVVVSVVCAGAGVYIGTTDPGDIDVNAIVRAGNEEIARGEYVDSRTGQPVTRTISTQSDSRRVNSGLRSSSRNEEVKPATDAADESNANGDLATSSSATTTELSAGEEEVATTTASSTAIKSENEESSEEDESIAN